MEKKRKNGTCTHCGIDRGDLEKKCRLLRLKLEHSQLRVGQLESENARLQELVRIYKWKAPSSLRSRPSMPKLPNEIWREVFRLATLLQGQAFSLPNDGKSSRGWSLSSTTRRSIPIVCRQWHSVGTEFLYERIVIQDPEQLHSLCGLLDRLDTPRLNKTLGWIRGVELVLGPVTWDIIPVVNRIQEFLITRLPLDQLTLLGIDHLNFDNRDPPIHRFLGSPPETAFSKHLEPMLARILRCQTNLRILYLHGVVPCVSQTILSNMEKSSDILVLPRLESLSLLDGRWSIWLPFSPNWPFLYLQSLFRTISTVQMNWTELWREGAGLTFLKGAPLLHTASIVVSLCEDFMLNNFARILRATPGLRLLTIVTADVSTFITANIPSENSLVHRQLETIVVDIYCADGWKVIGGLFPLFLQLHGGNLPLLSRIVIRLRSSMGGCLDAWTNFPNNYEDHWAQAIQICASADVNLVNQDGDPLHLWRHRHDIGVGFPPIYRSSNEEYEGRGPTGGNRKISHEGDINIALSNMDIDSASSEEEWRAVSRRSSDLDDESCDSGDGITDDSEDGEYRYTFQPDLEPVHLDTVSEPESAPF